MFWGPAVNKAMFKESGVVFRALHSHCTATFYSLISCVDWHFILPFLWPTERSINQASPILTHIFKNFVHLRHLPHTICSIRKQKFGASSLRHSTLRKRFLFSTVIMGNIMFNLFYRKPSEMGFCSHAELSCAYKFVVNVNSAALYWNLAWINSQNMSCRYYHHSPTGEVNAQQIAKASAPTRVAHSVGWNNSCNSVSLFLMLDRSKTAGTAVPAERTLH